ncbi:MAG: 4Fe-4S binding protein [Candidatus Loosdrechtia sp.]|uniref:4Fe-4S binding protein n=1 Tax=Candidatus Loosdrechtia sp. TaxID=3101272 RepID=UPI003A66B0D7|nr:MAG: 4Fe-4S binding protein [Candidatus Jettenia sp. AMX2]
MKRIRHFINNTDINRFRFYFQIISFAVLIYGGYFAINISNNMPTFVCVFAENRGGTCYLWPLQHQVNTPVRELLGGRGIGILTGLATFFILFILFNKAWCGFVCPLGSVQDWITKVRARLGIRNSTYSETVFRKLKTIKYIVLILLILLPLGVSNLGLPYDLVTSYCMICPARTILPLFSADTSQLVADFSSKTMVVLTGLGMAVTGAFFTGAFIKKRFYCFYCPMSALHYVFSKTSLLRMTKDGSRCTRCGNCYRVCDMGIREIADDVKSRNIVKDDCMMCFKCVAACPEDACLEVRFICLPVYSSTEDGFFKRMERKCRNGN